MDQHYTIEHAEQPERKDMNFVGQQLNAYNHARIGDEQYEDLVFFLRDANDQIRGGVLAATYWGWLSVNVLWVSEDLRGQGFGKALLGAAEQAALGRGCHNAFLDTTSFQARPFYEKCGYIVFGELEDMPAGHSRYFMKKRLQPVAS